MLPALLALGALVLWRYLRRRATLRNVPRPRRASLLWGHEKLEFEDDRASQWRAWFAECGKAFKIKAAWGHPDILVMGDPTGLSHIYTKNTYNYAHSPVFRPLIERLTGRGLIWVEGERAHRRMRSLVAPAFSAENVRNMHDAIYHVAHRLVADLQSLDGAAINAIEHTARATMDIIGRVAFGYDFNAVGGSEEAIRITDTWRKQNEMGCEDTGFVALLILRMFPSISSLPLEAIRAQGAVADTITRRAADIVRGGQIDEAGGGKDLMSLLLKANARQEKGTRVDVSEIYEHIITFVVAGHETTSSTLAFTLWELARNPDIQMRLRAEIASFSASGDIGYDDFADADRLPYLDAVCKEAMRLYPPSARNEKVSEQDDLIPLRWPIRGADGTPMHSIAVKKGQVIHIPSIGINRAPDVWGADADVFRPTRWLVGRRCAPQYCDPGETGVPPVEDTCGGWNGIFTFSEGPRICVGLRLALFEYKALLVTLVRSFEFQDTGLHISTRFGATLSPRVVGREREGINLPVRFTSL
ncbi:cytochrome P450 [Auricularia subglabra TFB-10046 SS5]|nr:cytochrome P450 [Auricularia subglabra TFB-10046 SS5]